MQDLVCIKTYSLSIFEQYIWTLHKNVIYYLTMDIHKLLYKCDLNGNRELLVSVSILCDLYSSNETEFVKVFVWDNAIVLVDKKSTQYILTCLDDQYYCHKIPQPTAIKGQLVRAHKTFNVWVDFNNFYYKAKRCTIQNNTDQTLSLLYWDSSSERVHSDNDEAYCMLSENTDVVCIKATTTTTFFQAQSELFASTQIIAVGNGRHLLVRQHDPMGYTTQCEVWYVNSNGYTVRTWRIKDYVRSGGHVFLYGNTLTFADSRKVVLLAEAVRDPYTNLYGHQNPLAQQVAVIALQQYNLDLSV
jgi:hypothetical protein